MVARSTELFTNELLWGMVMHISPDEGGVSHGPNGYARPSGVERRPGRRHHEHGVGMASASRVARRISRRISRSEYPRTYSVPSRGCCSLDQPCGSLLVSASD